MAQIDLELLLQAIPESSAAKSARRVFFNYLEQSTEERGYFHVDRMHGGGSGVLIKYNEVFFLLTARHVLSNNISLGFQNESPLWISVHSRPRWQSLQDFMFPRRIWNISETIDRDMPGIDTRDVCLIELFRPIPGSDPDHFIEVDDLSTHWLKEDQFFDGQVLVVCGYPDRLNQFTYDDPPEGFTHVTTVHKQLIPGCLLTEENGEMLISFCITPGDITHQFLNGMSGGPVINVMPDAAKAKLAGIALTGGKNICRFLPSHLICTAIINYQDCTCEVIDPLSDLGNSLSST